MRVTLCAGMASNGGEDFLLQCWCGVAPPWNGTMRAIGSDASSAGDNAAISSARDGCDRSDACAAAVSSDAGDRSDACDALDGSIACIACALMSDERGRKSEEASLATLAWLMIMRYQQGRRQHRLVR